MITFVIFLLQIIFSFHTNTLKMRFTATIATLALKFSVIALLFLLAIQVREFPAFTMPIAYGLVAFAIGLSFWSKLWLIILPALLPVLDLTPWSGRILITEFDYFILTSIAISLLFNRINFNFIKHLGHIKWLILLLIGSYSISTITGFNSIQESSTIPFDTYLTKYNSIRVAKGFYAALFFLPILAYEKKQGTPIAKFISIGIIAGFILTIISIVWERLVFPGFFDFSNTYRVSGLFSGLLLGGEMLDGYLFLAFPFLIVLFFSFNNAWCRLLGFIIFAGGLYSILVTFTRTNYLAISVVIVLLILGSLKIQHKLAKLKTSSIITFAAIVLLIGISIIKGGYIGERFATTQDSIEQRTSHWKNTLNIGNSGVLPAIFGNGKGSYPAHYFNFDVTGLSMARFWLKHEDVPSQHKNYLRFSASDQDGTLNVIQRFPVNQTGKYQVKITLRTPAKQAEKLLVEFCNKNILRFLDECQWLGFSTQENMPNQWQTITQELSADHFIKQLFSAVTPVDINLLNRGLNGALDIGQVEIFAPNGTQLLQNAAFENGFDHWFFSNGNHLAWHAKNLWVSAYFEGGLFELCLISFLLFYLAKQQFRSIQRGNPYALAILTALTGIIIVGLFGSIFDDPRVSWLFYLIVWLAILKPEQPAFRESKHTTLIHSLTPIVVTAIAASISTLYITQQLGYSADEVTSQFIDKVATKFGKSRLQTYHTKLDLPGLFQWRGQGANPTYNAIISRYLADGTPIPISDNPDKTIFTRLVKVNSTQQLLQAIADAQPGDGIELQTGIYTINQNVGIQKNGSIEKPIIVYAQQLGDVLIELNTVEGFVINAAYWTLQNLIIKGDCATHSQCEHSFHIIGNSDGTILRNNIIYDFNAAIKGNGLPQQDNTIIYPDNVLLEKNTFSNLSPRQTGNPVTTIDVVGGNNWHIKANFISDFIKLESDKTSYAAFLKGYGKKGVFEENLIMCNKNLYQPEHTQVGLSFGGGGTGTEFCFDKKCQYEHEYGSIQNNIIINCNDVGIYINKSKDIEIINNTLYNTAGIDIRFPESNATASNNLLTGKIKTRNQARLIEKNNYQAIEEHQFNTWFTNPDKANFTLLQSPSEPFPLGETVNNRDFCAQPVNSPQRKVGAIDSDTQSACKNLLNNTLAPFTKQFDETAHELVKQQEKLLQFTKAEQTLKLTASVCQQGCEFQDINAALQAVKTNGTLYIQAGNYQSCGYITRSVHIIGSHDPNNKTHLSQTACNGKAALIINAPWVTLENLEISNIQVGDNNGACLRIEANSRNLIINHLNCHDNQAGIIANAGEGKITIQNSLFERNGFAHGKVSNLSLNSEGTIEIINSKILSTVNKGHALQINAPKMLIEKSVIAGLNAHSSRAVDNTTGGELIIRNSVLQQGLYTDNDELIGFALGDKQNLLDIRIVSLENNQIIFDRKGSLFNFLLNKRKLFSTPKNTEIFLNNNTLVGMDSYGTDNINAYENKLFADRESAGISQETPHTD